MALKVDCEKGRVSYDLCTLLEYIPVERKMALAEQLGIDTDVIGYVAEQIIDRWTEEGNHGLVPVHASSEPFVGLEKAWRDVSKKSGEVANREILRLEEGLRRSEEEVLALREEVRRIEGTPF
jgi:hypothetical protein